MRDGSGVRFDDDPNSKNKTGVKTSNTGPAK